MYAVSKIVKLPDGTERVDSVEVVNMLGLLDLARRVDAGELDPDLVDVREQPPPPPDDGPPMYLAMVDNRTVILTDEGYRLACDGMFEQGRHVWMGAHASARAPAHGWRRIGRDVDGPTLWWRPEPVAPAPSTVEEP